MRDTRDIQIKTLTRQELYQYINSEDYRALKTVPITPHRALSQIRNPRAGDEDVLLLMAFEGEEHIGYLGVLPDYIHFSGSSCKAGWLSCLWISPGSRGKGVAKQLLSKAFECWDQKILGTEFTPQAEQLYYRSGKFFNLTSLEGIRLYIRFNFHELLPPRSPLFSNGKPFLKVTDSMLNTFHDLRLRFYNPELDHISLEYINHIDQESAEFIHQQQDKKAEFTRRKGDDLEWLINNPWIISAPIEDSLAERYHFTAVETLFDFTTLKVRHKEGYLIAFMIMTRRNGHLKLPYLYYRKGLISEVIRILVFHIAKWRINMFTTFHPQLVSALWEVRSPAWYKRAQHRDYIISRFFRDEVNGQTGIEFQDGDADNAFT